MFSRIVFGLAFILGITVFCAEYGQCEEKGQKIDAVAHRGFSAIAPENTIAAMKAAHAAGATGCECDVYATSDHVLVLCHDRTFNRTCGYNKQVVDCTFAETRKLDASKAKPEFEKFRGEPVPTFEEYLIYMKSTDMWPVIELKMPDIEEAVLALVRKHNMEKRVHIISFNAQAIAHVKQLAPKVSAAWLCSYKKDVPEAKVIENVLTTLKDIGIDTVDIAYSNVTPGFMAAMRKAGIHVWAWTIDKEEIVQDKISLGVESITSNRVGMLIEQLKKAGKY
ncbi:MAG: glycerophosphodiester phosphodiesterase family protein [Thermoguttaceae bacterium]|nr:glycerophosphodiester phosphodiesterase family protein [Thermoguttaceae bacterium]